MDSTVYNFPATLVADLNPDMNEEKSAFAFELDELVGIRDFLVQKVELGRAWNELPLVPNSSTPLPLHTSLVHNVRPDPKNMQLFRVQATSPAPSARRRWERKHYDTTSGGTSR